MVQKQRKAKPQQKQEKQKKNKLSKYIKKRPKGEKTKRDNTYVFEGFYEKLKSIDVKHSHALDANFIYDRLITDQDLQDDNEDGQLFRSNFIQLLRNEKANNKTVEFGKVYSDLEKFCYSYPLLIHNKRKIIEKLLSYLQNSDTLKVIQAGVVDLFIALIKDFRQDIYAEFLELIMPAVISSIDITNVILLDRVFTMISFAIKYLTKAIKDDIENFYNTYFELLIHKNKFIRKFAAQSFCYVIRKLDFNEKLLNLLIEPISKAENDQEMINKDQQQTFEQEVSITSNSDVNKIAGISDLIFEVMYGAAETLHSKADEILNQILKVDLSKRQYILLVRCVFLKLVNHVDTMKQQQIYDVLVQNLKFRGDNERELNILMLIFKDCIKLKYGKRLSDYGIIQMTTTFNNLLQKNIQNAQKLSKITKINIAETLSLLFYFKHNTVLKIFAKSNVDFSTSKNIYNHSIYQLANSSSTDVISTYFKLFMCENSEISNESDVDWAKILGLKQSSSNQMEFSKESHRQKLKLLIRALNKYVLKQISEDNHAIEYMAMLEILVHQSGDNFFIELNNELEEKLIKKLQTQMDSVQKFVLYKFVSLCKSQESGPLVKYLLNEKKNQVKSTKFALDLKSEISDNLVLKSYQLTETENLNFLTSITQLLDLTNLGDESLIQSQIISLIQSFLSRNTSQPQKSILDLVQANPSDIVTLRSFNQIFDQNKTLLTLNPMQHAELFKSLSANLQKNQRQLRLQTLQAVAKFEKLDFKKPEDAGENEQTREGKCEVIKNMLEFEQTEVLFETEKSKILQIERIKAMIEADLVPELYLDVCYDFLVGCLWIKFTPLFKEVQNTLNAMVRANPKKYGKKLLDLLKNLDFLTQLRHDNENLMELLKKQRSLIQSSQNQVIEKSYLRETNLDEDFIEVKDFFYNLSKGIDVSALMEDKELRTQAFELFYQFIDKEYSIMYFFRSTYESQDLLDAMTYSNMLDSEEFKTYRRSAYSKLYCYLEIFSKADQLRKIPQLQKFQQLMIRLLNTSDTKLQKLALDCLLRADDKGVIRQYRKLLEGFNDDMKFKDMIQVLIFGSQNQTESNSYYTTEEGDSKKQEKGSIPKLQEQHRLDVLPIVIKMLLSKVLNKKGAINKKTVHTRRHIVYQFMASLKPETELKLFFNEILSVFNLEIESSVFDDKNELQNRLAHVSFSGYLSFISSFSVMIKQMGNVLSANQYLEKITNVFIQVLSMSKLFIKHLKLSLVEENEQQTSLFENEDKESQDKIEAAQDQQSQKDTLYRFVGKQSKVCLRKGLSIVKQMYTKFTHHGEFINQFSEKIYQEIIQDQIGLLNQNYIIDKSQLLEIVTTHWTSNPQNYLTYQEVFPALMSMLSQPKINPEVYDLHFQLLKSLILKSIHGIEDKRDLAFLVKSNRRKLQDQRDEDVDDEDQEMNEAIEAQEREIAQSVIQNNISSIAQNLNVFCQNHLQDLKKSLMKKGQTQKPKGKPQPQELSLKKSVHEVKNQTIRDLVFVMAEIANYLEQGDPLNQGFLEMIVSVLSMRNLLQFSSQSQTSYHEELLYFGSKSICNLILKVDQLEANLIDKIYQMFLSLKSLRIRSSLSNGLAEVIIKNKSGQEIVQNRVLEIVSNLNRIKRGVADMEFDYDLIIKTIQKLTENSPITKDFNQLEVQLITYSILYLLQNEEFSVRDFSSHYLKQLFEALLEQPNQALVSHIEQTLLSNVRKLSEELTLKTTLDTLRYFIVFLSKQPSSHSSSPLQLSQLLPLVNLKDENEDFFALFLSIKMKSRQRALKLLKTKLSQNEISYKVIQAIVMPLINYVVFGTIAQKNNRRNTISYSRDERRQAMEEALNVYKEIASQLKWSDYFKLLKTLLFKLQKASNKVNSEAESQDDDMSAYERTIMKCICKILDGFNFKQVPDTLETLNKADDLSMADVQTSNDLEEIMKKVLLEGEDDEDIDGQESDADKDELEIDQDQEMLDEKAQVEAVNDNSVTDIQRKLYQKILPILERHITDQRAANSEDSPRIRSFVVLSITKLIRRLPLHTFQNSLGKLISSIVSKGLRQKDISAREKGRKSLLRIVEELSPKRCLALIFEEMADQLQKAGYQTHTYLYSVFYLLQQLHEKKILKPGDVTNQIIESNAQKYLDELFNQSQVHQIEDREKIKIKESKAKKVIPTFELFAQYINFKQTFFILIAPIIKSLESNPTISKIQQCEELFNRMSTTLLKNESLQTDDLLLFMYTIIHRGISNALKVKINDEKQQRDYGARVQDVFVRTKEEYKEQTFKVETTWRKSHQTLSDKKSLEISGRVLGSFGLQCLKKALKERIKLSSTEDVISKEGDTQQQNASEEMRAKLDPFVGVLIDALKTYHQPIIVTTLHVMGQIIHINLPSFKDRMKKFLNRLFKLFDQTNTGDTDFLNSLFKCTAELIKTYATYQDLTQPQLKALIQVIKSNMNGAQVQNNVLQCLKAIIYRKFMSPDLYDLIESVQEMMITNISKPTRNLCASIFLNFLLEYPLEDTRLEQHFNHLLKNLGYFDSESRLQLLDVLHTLCDKLPREVMDQYGELLFFTLVLRAVNESNSKCRERVQSVLKKIIHKVSQQKAKALFNTVIQMSSANDQQKQLALQQAKLLVLGLFIESSSHLKQTDITKILEQCTNVISQEALKIKESREKILKKRKRQEDQSDGDQDDEVEEDLQNPEMREFLKNIELIDDSQKQQETLLLNLDERKDTEEWSALYYALVNVEKLLAAKKENLQMLVTQSQTLIQDLLTIGINHRVYWLRLIIQRLFSQILQHQLQSPQETSNTKPTPKKATNQTLGLDVVTTIYHMVNVFKFRPMTEELGSLLSANILTLLRINCANQNRIGQKLEEQQQFQLQKFFSRVSFVARKMMLNIQQAKDRLQWILHFFLSSVNLFEELSNQEKDNSLVRQVIEPMMTLVYRLYTDEQYHDTRAKQQAFELVDYFSNHIDKSLFINIYNQVKANIQTKRNERKKQQKLMMASADGAKIKEKKRKNKAEKKKIEKKQKKLMMELRKS